MKRVLIVLSIFVSGCETTSTTSYASHVNGRYYLVDELNCDRYQALPGQALQCLTKDGKPTYVVKPMTPDEIIFYQQSQSRNNQSMTCFTTGSLTTCQ